MRAFEFHHKLSPVRRCENYEDGTDREPRGPAYGAGGVHDYLIQKLKPLK